ncbi:hypothetical protein GCM10011487_70330 [Steroidobacter agaridevorans]|uniref:Uncharacterized protein n=1 Tax=Steroidobacter agaridevorans TaxID=2695856 RepID=A0A829YQI7_9GAMM|nr:hypothetical protein GCM10011487_70330 [Steroidobacter agaridevorans]
MIGAPFFNHFHIGNNLSKRIRIVFTHAKPPPELSTEGTAEASDEATGSAECLALAPSGDLAWRELALTLTARSPQQ